MGIRSLAAALRAEILRSFGRGARLAGATHLKGLPGEDSAPAALQALDVVEFDGHRLDAKSWRWLPLKLRASRTGRLRTRLGHRGSRAAPS